MYSAIALIAVAAVGGGGHRAISYDSFIYRHHLFHMVVANLQTGQCSVQTVHNDWLTSVHKLVDRCQPLVAITGTFFSPGSQKCVGDVVVDGNMVAHGARGTAVAVDWFGKVSIFDEPFNSQIDWDKYQFGLRGAVRVVNAGKVCPDPRAQRFHDPHIWGKAARIGLGLTKAGKLVLFGTADKVTLSELGGAMRKWGIRNGVSLDGGASTCFYYNGDFLIAPHRKLCNLLVVSEKD